MKIIIAGPGAMGLLLTSLLSKSKEEIWLLDKNKKRTAKIKEKGISVEGLCGSWKTMVRITTSPEEIGPADLIILCVKSYDTKNALANFKPLLGRETMVLSVQNGLGNLELIAEVAEENKVIGGVTNLGATLVEETKVRFAGNGETVIGLLNGGFPVELRHIRELFNRVGITTKVSRDIKGVLWSKLLINTGINALTAILQLPNGKLVESEGTRRIMRAAVTEATRIAKRKRIKLLYDDPLAKVEAVCEATATNLSSMLQDVLKEKNTEIDFINGVIVRLGQELSIPVPTNLLLLDLVKTIEATYATRARS
ncbi:MAG: 2-dehydropantoate 2-reductase [Candidatus Omnitrophica bacterium]|nr:2-dehydropantoate 2-reductase [Candidatus Omnitrophota bacterium]